MFAAGLDLFSELHREQQRFVKNGVCEFDSGIKPKSLELGR